MKLGEPIIIWIIKSKGTVDKRLDRDKDNPSAAKNDFTQALQLYPGNIWAQLMNKDIH